MAWMTRILASLVSNVPLWSLTCSCAQHNLTGTTRSKMCKGNDHNHTVVDICIAQIRPTLHSLGNKTRLHK